MADPVLGGYVDKAGVKRSVKGVAIIGGTDGDGGLLPSNFDSLPMSSHTTWDGFFPLVATYTKVSGATTYTKTETYTNDGTNITDVVTSDWDPS